MSCQNQSPQPSWVANWNQLQQHRSELTKELQSMARESSGETRRRLSSLARWARQPRKIDELLQHPDALALVLPVVQEQKITNGRGLHLLRSGVPSLAIDLSFNKRFFNLLSYAAFVFSIMVLLAWFFSRFLIPNFEEMFEEFGIGLPALTLFVLQTAEWIRKVGLFFVFIPLLSLIGVRVVGHLGGFKRLRSSTAAFAWHIALLMEAGFSNNEALHIARRSKMHESLLPYLNVAADPTRDDPWEDERQQQPPSLIDQFPMLGAALSQTDSPSKIADLRVVAALYWDPARVVRYWLIHWLVICALWLFAIMLILAVVSLVMPLIAILSGLTGF